MTRAITRMVLMLLAAGLFSTAAFAQVNIGIVSFDLGNPPGSTAGTYNFDITNMTGSNSSNSSDFPVLIALDLTGLSLIVNFTNGSSQTFSLGSTGPGANLSTTIGFTNDVTSATLTGTLSPLAVTLFGTGAATLSLSFSATLLPSEGFTLQDGDSALIVATTGTLAPIPEPGTWMLLGTGLMGLLLLRRRLLPDYHPDG